MRVALAHGDVAAVDDVQIDVGLLVGNGHGVPPTVDDPSDIDVAPLPRLCDLSRPNTAPRVVDPIARVQGWGWGVPRTSREPDLAMRLILYMTSRDRHAAELEEFPILRVRNDVSPRWQLSRRLNEVGDAQLSGDRARFVDWPKHAGELEQIERRIGRAFRDLVIERRYRGAAQPIERSIIEARLHELLDDG